MLENLTGESKVINAMSLYLLTTGNIDKLFISLKNGQNWNVPIYLRRILCGA